MALDLHVNLQRPAIFTILRSIQVYSLNLFRFFSLMVFRKISFLLLMYVLFHFKLILSYFIISVTIVKGIFLNEFVIVIFLKIKMNIYLE